MTLEQLKKKIRYGDYSTLGLMLGINPDAAKMRFMRNDDKAIIAMTLIIESRERLIADFSSKK
ncbi:hypothetical protein [Flavobacterium silvaticum]|uniref:Uncharacterized protein n=1 Tax=Flavobacterium silvaticum TaxID=1852020 RepID=A0A972FPS9_9FLAO|nr:hypothetical protein [Flavobacterium silvaticum]NMH29612.1 hypothetical protein [Flavobacterium silvaticum]